jgi:nucleotide-binding universal stress UspA family protein
MFANIVVPLKEGLPTAPLTDLATSVAASGAKVHLVTFLRLEKEDEVVDRLREVEQSLEALAAGLRDDLDVSCEVGLVGVAAASNILAVARQREADLMVVGLAKRTRVGKALMGSDAQRILIGTHCPVLVRPIYGDA